MHFWAEGEMTPPSVLLCCDGLTTVRIRASGHQHSVERRHADGSFGLLCCKTPGSQPRSDQYLVAAHRRFD